VNESQGGRQRQQQQQQQHYWQHCCWQEQQLQQLVARVSNELGVIKHQLGMATQWHVV
jgi:hypothetical protein